MLVVLGVIAGIVLTAAGVRALGTPVRPVRFYSAITMLTAVLAGTSAYALGGRPVATALLICGLVAGVAGLCVLAEVSARRRGDRARRRRARRGGASADEAEPVRPGR